jgi:hypothetical protein
VAACGGSGSSPAPETTSPAPAASGVESSPLAGVALSSDEATEALRTIVVRQLPPGGNNVEGQATLDLCNGNYASERRRTERLQVLYVKTGQRQTIASEEVVRYESGGADAAYRELRAVARGCTHKVPLPGGGHASGLRIEPEDRALPVRQLMVSFKVTAPGQPPVYTAGAFLYQRHLFTGAYVFAGSRSDARRELATFATAVAGKLITS